MTRIYAVMAVVLSVSLMAVTLYFVTIGRPKTGLEACRNADFIAGPADLGGSFTLTDASGRQVSDREILTKPSLVYFGYTFCPDICPVDNARNADAVDLLHAEGIEAQSVFITVDPARDTPAVLRDYTESFSPAMIGLTGTEAQLREVERKYRVYSHISDPSESYYLVDHSTFTYLMLPGSRYAGAFRRDTTAQEMADRVACALRVK